MLYAPFAAKRRRYVHIIKTLKRLLKDGSFFKLPTQRRKSLLLTFRQRLRALKTSLSPEYMKRALAGVSILLANTSTTPLSAQSFGSPVTSPFGFEGNIVLGFPFFSDLDNDGDKDMLLVSEFGNILFFKNTGTTNFPDFSTPPIENPFGISPPSDITTLTAVDLDNDGDQDLVIGKYDNGGFYFLKNIGTPANPVFSTPVFNPFGLIGSLEHDVPYFTDIDGDGDLDLFSAQYGSDMRFFKNIGTPTTPVFASPQNNPFGISNINAFINLPVFFDADGDGDTDLLNIGLSFYYSSDIFYQENIGTSTSSQFALPVLNPPFLNIDSNYSLIPAVADIDGDGDQDIFLNSFSTDGFFILFLENKHIFLNVPPTAADSDIVTEEDEAYFFKIPDFNFKDDNLSDQLSAIQITQLPLKGTLVLSGNPIIGGQTIPASEISNLVFVPKPDENGLPYAHFIFRVSDGQLWSISEYTVRINVTPVNDFPVSSNAGITGLQNQVYTFKKYDFPFTDVDGDTLSAVRITALPSKGKLKLNDADVVPNQTIPVGQIHQLTFTPTSNEFGTPYTTFKFQVSDGILFSVSNYTMTVNIQQTSADQELVISTLATLSPNPAGDWALLEISSTHRLKNTKITVQNAAGSEVARQQWPDGSPLLRWTLDMKEWPAGLYVVHIRAGEYRDVLKLVKF